MAEERRTADADILAQLAVLGERVRAIDARTIRLVRLLEGEDDTPGMRTRLDRLEQAEKRQRGYHLAWFTAVVTAAVGWLQGWINGPH